MAFLTAAGTLSSKADMVAGRTLTFSERVAYQYAIEEVYWRHRVWPKDNPGPKPPLDAVVSQREIEQKVSQCLCKSHLVTDARGSPITATELQAEMNRMASHTKEPDVLRELFEALGNDPFVVAECLVRPILAERPSNELTAESGIEEFVPNASLLDAGTSTSHPYTLPEISVPLDCADDAWSPTTTVNAPAARRGHTAVWTGSEMIIWGGTNVSGNLNSGSRYDPATDSWMATSIANAPSPRWLHTAVWTGTEIIVWGGGSNNMSVNTGGRYNPIGDSWTTTSTNNAPTGRDYHTAVWTGSEMIVWGGSGCGGNCTWNTGGRYNPATDSWTATSTANAPVARDSHNALWTGGEMIVWGGADEIVNHTFLHTGGRYNPGTDSWMPTGLINVPLGRFAHTGVWTGSEMIIWGGVDEFFNATNTGGRYNPVNDSWVATSLTSAPSPRASHTGLWTGSEMIAWAGNDTNGFFNNGGRYNPKTDSWRATTTVNAPGARTYSTGVWAGSQMIVWGGTNDVGYLNTGGMYCAQPSAPISQSVVSRKSHGRAGNFDLALPLNGTSGIECRTGGATNDYTLVVTFLANVSVNGNPQAAVTSGMGIIGSGGVSNGGRVTTADNVVIIPLTNVGNAQTINVTLYGVNGSTNFVIPMRILIGDTNANGAVNASDVSQIKARVGQQIDGTNFRSDLNANGYIDAVDIALVKSSLGTGLP